MPKKISREEELKYAEEFGKCLGVLFAGLTYKFMQHKRIEEETRNVMRKALEKLDMNKEQV